MQAEGQTFFNCYYKILPHVGGIPGGSVVKKPPANMGSIPASEDPLEEETATPSSILAWEIPWTEEPGGLQSMGAAKSQT